MKRRILAIVLAGALTLSLTACGAGKNDNPSSNPGGGNSGQADSPMSDAFAPSNDPSASGGSQPDGSSPDAALPDAGGADASEPDSGAGGTPDPVGEDIKLTLNRTSIELNKAGATFKLRYTVDPDIYDGVAVFTSSDTKVATVDESGTVKAVAPGKAVITVKYDSAAVTASVNCNWKAESDKPAASHPAVILPDGPSAPGGDPSAPGGEPSASGSDPSAPAGDPSAPTDDPSAPAGDTPAPANVDLSAFYTAIAGKYTFAMPMLADDEILNNFYSGMTGIGTEQRLIYVCGMTPNNGEFGLVQVKDSKDVETVKNIFRARINYMAGDGNGPGGAWYPQAMDSWADNSRVVSNGNYVMMVVHESCDDIVKAFNALF